MALNLTYRSNTGGTLHAAYRSTVRIGYVEVRATGQWRWQLSLVQADGGYVFGVADDEDDAKLQLATAFSYWCQCAKLKDAP